MAAQDSPQPAEKATVEVADAVQRIRELSPSARRSKAIEFWDIGETIRELRAGGRRDAVTAVSKEVGISDRELRYCVAVRQAFERDRLEALESQGMTWSTARVLAADHLKDHREHLIAAFEASSLSNAALRSEVLSHRRGPARKGTVPGPGEAALWEKAKQVTARSERLRRDIARARRLLDEGTPSGPAGEGASLTPQTQQKVRQMTTALKKLTADIEALLTAVTRRCDETAPSSPGAE